MKLGLPLVLSLLNLVGAEEVQSPLSFSDNTISTRSPHQIAIIGGGAAGSSAAYHLRQYLNDSPEVNVNTTLFEASSRIGGRTTTVNVFDDETLTAEVGGSIFVAANEILYNATQEFGLSIKTLSNAQVSTGSDFDLGIWDGSKFVFKQASDGGRWQGYWDILKLLWKYGMAPVRTQRLTADMISRFLTMYEEPVFPFESLQKAVEDVDLMHLMPLTGERFLAENGISQAFANDIIQASTRVNYAINLNQVSGLESLVCMATDGAMAVDGGNWQIFDQMVKRADIKVNMKTPITKVAKDQVTGKYTLHTNSSGEDFPIKQEFDIIILASPYQSSNIDFLPPLKSPPEHIEYVGLHVTLFTSPHLLSPSFFGLSDPKQVPSTVLTTLPYRALGEHDPSKFFSVSTLRTIRPGKQSDKTQHLYKIFSSEPLKASFLAELFGFEIYTESGCDGIASLSDEHITWYHYKFWHSYPREVPRTSFGDLKLDSVDENRASGVYYTSVIEPFISTMETSALMGANIAKLIVDELVESEPDTGGR